MFLEIGIDPTKLEKGAAKVDSTVKKTKDAVKSSGQEIESSAKNASLSIEKLQGQVLMLFAAFTAGKGIKNFIQDVIGTDASLGRMAYTLDSTVQKLGTWSGAGAMVGASAQEIIGSFQTLTSQFQQFALTGESSVIPYFRALNVDISDSHGRMRDLGDVFLDLADRFKAMDPARAAEFGKQMGLSPGMINLLIQGRKAVEEYLSTAKRYAPTQRDVQAAYDLQKAWNQMTMSSTRMGRSFLTDVAPALKTVIEMFTKLADWMAEHPAVMNLAIGALTTAVLALSTALTVQLAGVAIKAVMAGFTMILEFLPGLMLEMAVLTETTLPGLAAGFLATGVAIEAMLWPLALATAAYFALGAAGKWAHDNLLDEEDKKQLDKFAQDQAAQQQAAESGATLPAWLGGKGQKPAAAANTAASTAAPPWWKGATKSLSDLVGRGEGGYDSVNLGQRGGYASSKRDLGSMSVAEVMAAQQRGEFNAAGKYQIIKTTLPGAVKSLGLSGNEKFDQALQDRIFNEYLIKTKQAAIGDYISGKSGDLHAAVKAASSEWASLMDPDTGATHYPGVGNNKASVSAAEVASALQSARAANLPSTDNSRSSVSTSKAETNIGTINLHLPNARNADDVANGLAGAIKRNTMAQQANFGQS